MSEKLSWIERAEKLVKYHDEAFDFVRRASEQLPVFPEDAHAVARLWVEVEQLDSLVCGLLDEMNTGLLNGKADMDTTRGASMRTGMMDDQYVAYECSWMLLWERGFGVAVNLAIDPRSRAWEANVQSLKSRGSQSIRFPLSEIELKDALVDAYVSEATLDSRASSEFVEEQE
jgi:hypothetical protein